MNSRDFNMNLRDLDSNNQEAVENVKALLKDQFNSTSKSWIMEGMYDYFISYNSLRVVDVIASVKEPHDCHFFDKCLEGLRGNNRHAGSKLPHLVLLGHVVRRRPIWLFNISKHAVFSELLFLLKTETDIVTVVSALLIIDILLPFIPGVLGKHLPQLFSVFSKLAAMNTSTDKYHEAQLIHLQISLYTLFHRLYGMFPHNFLLYLQEKFSADEPVFWHTVKPMLDTVRVNHVLITHNSESEKGAERWKNNEPHDIIIACAKLLMTGSNVIEQTASAFEAGSSFDCTNMFEALKASGKCSVMEYCNELGKKSDEMCIWSPSNRYQGPSNFESTPTTIPLTPITRGFEVSSPYSEHEGSSPPETAVEATPETTPCRDYADLPRPPMLMRIVNRPIEPLSPVTGSKVPMSDRSFPNSPVKKDVSQFPFTVPSSPNTKSKPVEKLLHDRYQIQEEDSGGIEFKPVGLVRNDLNTNSHREKLISTSTSTASMAIPGVEHSLAVNVGRRQTNGHYEGENGFTASHENNVLNVDSVDDYEDCELEKSGSPCTSGGLHMPDRSQLQKFAKSLRTRYYSQTQSDTDGRSTGTSPQDINNYLNDNKVRRTNSCPEIKKSSPSSMVSFAHSDKLSLPEENEEDEDTDNTTARSFTENHVSKRVDLVNSGTQTEEVQSSFHFPYEHLFLDVFPPLHSNTAANDYSSATETNNSVDERHSSVYEKMFSPSQLLQKYIDAAVSCHTEKKPLGTGYLYEPKFLVHQLRLLSAQMQFEEHRREIHAERNRRLLGRSRRNKTLEEHNSKLKDTVLEQQKKLEESARDRKKIEQIQEEEVQNERKYAEYWRERYCVLEQDYKRMSDRCLEIEARLKNEEMTTVNSNRLIYEGKAALTDVTNELNTSQREAKAAKELRPKVARLQAEVVKAGEMIVRYHQRLDDMIKPPAEGTQHELMHASYVNEISRLKETLNIQSASLEAATALISQLRNELTNRENDSRRITEQYKVAQEERKRELKELRKSHEELMMKYNREADRANELHYQLDNAKRVNRLSQVPLAIGRGLHNVSGNADSMILSGELDQK